MIERENCSLSRERRVYNLRVKKCQGDGEVTPDIVYALFLFPLFRVLIPMKLSQINSSIGEPNMGNSFHLVSIALSIRGFSVTEIQYDKSCLLE